MSYTITESQFDDWNSTKKKSHYKENQVGFKEREIFWARIGQNIGAEEYGKGNEFQRPVLILRKLTSNIFIGIPLTSTLKNNDYFHSFEYTTKKGKISSTAMILQLKTFDKKRLMTRIGMLNKEDFEKVVEKTRNLFIPLAKQAELPEGELQR
jgi:mRNA interferase MazF